MLHPAIQTGIYVIRNRIHCSSSTTNLSRDEILTRRGAKYHPFMTIPSSNQNNANAPIPVITADNKTEWVVQLDTDGSYTIQNSQNDEYVDDITDVKNTDDIVLTKDNSIHCDILYDATGYYQIRVSGTTKLFRCNGCNKQVTAITPQNPDDPNLLWDFELVQKDHPRYEPFNGFFVQDNLSRNGKDIVIYDRFGLKNNASDRWTKFWEKIKTLNENNSPSTYKLIFFGRHGEGVHNIAIKKYKSKWPEESRKDGDCILTWADAELTQDGDFTSLYAQSVWNTELAADSGFQYPKISYSSPLTRCLSTNTLTFGTQLKSLVVEDCREKCTLETPERRRPLEYITDVFPHFAIEKGFTKDDEVFSTTEKETFYDIQCRALNILDRIFSDDSDVFASVTTHSGFIAALTTVIGRPPYALTTGGVLPIVIKRTP